MSFPTEVQFLYAQVLIYV